MQYNQGLISATPYDTENMTLDDILLMMDRGELDILTDYEGDYNEE